MADHIVTWYEQGVLTAGQLQAAVDEAVAELAGNPDELAQLGISPGELAGTRVVVQQEGGFIVEGILLAIAIGAGGNLAADASKALVNAIVKRVRNHHGDDAVGPEKQPGDEEDAG